MTMKNRIVLKLYERDPSIRGGACLSNRLPCISEEAAWTQLEKMIGAKRAIGARILRLRSDDKDVVEAECLATIGKVCSSD